MAGKKFSPTFLLGIVLISLLSISLHFGMTEAWGVEGHAIIAQIAFNRLSSIAQERILDYIAPAAGVQNISSDPDDYDHTSHGLWSAPLHFVNMPSDASEFVMDLDCLPYPPSVDCVVGAIINFTKYLESSKVNPHWPHDEPSPVSYLIHFIGDCHQPLHVGYLKDLGGLDISVKFFDTDTDLHDVWDTYLIQNWEPETSKAISHLENIMQENDTIVQEALELTSPNQWANQSFQIVRSGDVYDYDPKFEGESETNSLLDLTPGYTPYLGDNYYHHNIPIVQVQLIRGAVRLGVVLEMLFGN